MARADPEPGRTAAPPPSPTLPVPAGPQPIPREVYEAARVDGAGAVQRFWRVTLPLVTPAPLVAVLSRTPDVLRTVDLPTVLIGIDERSV